MAINDSAVRDGGRLDILLAPLGTARPSLAAVQSFDPATGTGTGLADFDHFGHTDLENDIETEREGGDTEVRGSRQNPRLRERVTEPAVDRFTISSIQFTEANLRYFYGDGTVVEAGVFESTGSFATTERVALFIFTDGDIVGADFYPRMSVKSAGPQVMAREGFRQMPFLFTPLSATGQPYVAVIDEAIPAPLTDEVQEVSISGGPTGGTFTLTHDTQTTAGIAYNATAAAVQSALEALSNIDPGDVTVTGGPLPTTAVTVTFGGQYDGVNVAQMTASSTGLTGGTSPTATVTTITEGGAAA